MAENPEQIQIQVGNHNRSGARDYLEIHQYFGKERWLLQATLEEKNRFALNDEDYFKERFGFRAPLEQRRDVIELKNRFDFTDKEIWLLKFSGLLTVRKGMRTSICACRGVYYFGIAYLLLTVVIIGFPAVILTIGAPSLLAFWSRLLGFSVVFLFLYLFNNYCSLKPVTLILQRNMRIGEVVLMK